MIQIQILDGPANGRTKGTLAPSYSTLPCEKQALPCPALQTRQNGGQRRLQIPRLRFDAPFHCAHKFCLKRGKAYRLALCQYFDDNLKLCEGTLLS